MENIPNYTQVNVLDIAKRKYHKVKFLLTRVEKEVSDLQKLITFNKTPVFRANIVKEDFILSFS